MIERRPHNVFVALWALWSLYTLSIAAELLRGPTVWSIWMGSFLLIELTGVFYRDGEDSRDTLSENVTWVHRHLSKTTLQLRGWGAAVTAYAFVCAYVGTLPIDSIGRIPLLLLVTVWLSDHWIKPATHG